jgi:hypothetical protein
MKYFISGHRDVTVKEFNEFYKPMINMAQNYLVECGMEEKTTVFHMNEQPMNYNCTIKNKVGGFKTDEERDSAMTDFSDFDIAFVRCNKWKDSGTAINLRRRFTMKYLVN